MPAFFYTMLQIVPLSARLGQTFLNETLLVFIGPLDRLKIRMLSSLKLPSANCI